MPNSTPNTNPDSTDPEVLTPDGIADSADHVDPASVVPTENVAQPAKVLRVGSMIRQLLDEMHNTDLDAASRSRIREVYAISVRELGEALSEDLRAELGRLVLPFIGGEEEPDAETVPSGAELRIAQAQLIGWLEGLFHGIQATLMAQQVAARQQLEEMRGQLGVGETGGAEGRPGTYL